MKNAKLFILTAVIIIAGLVFVFYKKYSNPPPKPIPAAENKELTTNLSNNMKISSPSFENNADIPRKFTCDGENINPALSFSDVPSEAKSLALILHDPDAPMAGGFTHWVVVDMDSAAREIKEASKPETGLEGTNSGGKVGYTGPCPPSGVHHYQFLLYALDAKLNLGSSATKTDVEKAMEGHILEQATLVGLYKR